MTYTINRAQPVDPPVESVTLEVSPEEVAVLRYGLYLTLSDEPKIRQDLDEVFSQLYPAVDLYSFYINQGRDKSFKSRRLLAYLGA